MEQRLLEPANGEPCVLAVKEDVGSLLAKLAVQFTLVLAGHPFSVVLVNRLATKLSGTLLRVSFGLVNAFAVRMAGQGVHNKDSNDGT